MVETKNVTKKVEEVAPVVTPTKEQVEQTESTARVPEHDESYREIIESAASVGVTIPDGGDLTLLARALIDKLLKIDESLRPLAQAIEKDKRVEELLADLCRGESIEDALLESEIIGRNRTDPDEKNLNDSLAEAEKFCTQHQLEHTAIDCFAQFVQDTVAEVTKGKITQDVLALFWKSFIFDKEVQEAFEAGLLKGRNTNIEELRNERGQNDGMGSIVGGASIDKAPLFSGYIERIIKNKR